MLGYVHWTVVTHSKENVTQVGTPCSCTCFDSSVAEHTVSLCMESRKVTKPFGWQALEHRSLMDTSVSKQKG